MTIHSIYFLQANEVGAVAALLSELLQIPSSPNDQHHWVLANGFSTPYFVFSERRSAAKDEADDGCVCPPVKFELPLVVKSVHERLRAASLLCLDKAAVTDGVETQWVARMRKLLWLPARGCSIEGWAASDVLLRYLEDSHQIKVPEISESQWKQAMQENEHLAEIAAGTVAFQHRLSSLLSNNICVDEAALEGCSRRVADSRVFRIERFAIRQKDNLQLRDSLAFVDVSLSNRYSGSFTLQVPRGNYLTNVYRNVTVFAAQLIPLDLVLKESRRAIEVSHSVLQYKETIKEYYRAEIEAATAKNDTPFLEGLVSLFVLQPPAAVKLEKSDFREHPPAALMLASHFDTAVSSPGGADAGSGVAIALEVLRNVLHAPQVKLNRPLMLVLNGCEENILPGSHAFSTMHPWMRNQAGMFLNLEAAGSVLPNKSKLQVEYPQLTQ